MQRIAFTLSALALSLTGLPTQAATLVLPNCLLNQTHFTYTSLANENQFQLIQTDEAGLNALVQTHHQSGKHCGGFVNVSDDTTSNPRELLHRSLIKPAELSTVITPTDPSPVVSAAINKVLPQNIWNNLTLFSAAKDRYANHESGVQATAWIQNTVENYAKAAGRDDVHAFLVPTPGYKQSSLVIKIGDGKNAGLVIGAHADGIAAARNASAPAADDDGSGAMSVLEAARVVLLSQPLNKPVYFIWYAAEEEGLVGSGAVVKYFKKNKIPVKQVMHFDLTGYEKNNEKTLWVMDDYTNPKLTQFVVNLMQTYLNLPVQHSECGYACSDHASWYQAGYATVLPAETAYEDTNPDIHSAHDTIDKLSSEHMAEYAKVAVAFGLTLGLQ